MFFQKSLTFYAFIATFVRILFMMYGEWQDRTMVVKFTDVDYYVFTDAARYMANGRSPYLRATYRYTPLLAAALLPNIWITMFFGKLLFITCDVATGVLIHSLCLKRFCSEETAIFTSLIWLMNPMPVTVSSRGNAESILSLLVLLTLVLLMSRRTVLAAIVYGLSVHIKIYPVTYALPIYLFLNTDYDQKCTRRDMTLTGFLKDLLPGKTRFLFIGISVSTFLAVTGICYHLYGFQFLQETYLHHVTRRDTRHNFSVYFYMLYLTGESSSSLLLGLMAFIPQMGLLVILSFRYYQDLPFCCFLHTLIFVTFNKVCTSQYFLWYLCLLPVVIPTLATGAKSAIAMIAAWFLAQALWLLPAYFVEFRGQDTFIFIWLAGLLFFTVNIGITGQLIQDYRHCPVFVDGKLHQEKVEFSYPKILFPSKKKGL
ncbi:GPI mannosyltransferase 1-like [Lineus longissimus]|uniref:GPI mannosyltransferase 1-like n=1 Tax=Lineus longissimus TaxID=88925 RepID=UPI00315C91D3